MADVTISDLSPLTPSTGLVLPVSNGTSTGRVTLSQVCGVMTSTQIVNALGYTPYNGTTNPNGYITSSSLPSSQLLPRAWVNFDGNNVTIRNQYNISGVSRNNTGRYTLTFTNALPNANYALVGSSNYDNTVNTGGAVTFYVMNQSSSSFQVGMRGYDGQYYNCHTVNCVIF